MFFQTVYSMNFRIFREVVSFSVHRQTSNVFGQGTLYLWLLLAWCPGNPHFLSRFEPPMSIGTNFIIPGSLLTFALSIQSYLFLLNRTTLMLTNKSFPSLLQEVMLHLRTWKLNLDRGLLSSFSLPTTPVAALGLRAYWLFLTLR